MDSLPSSSAGTIASVEASQRSSQQKLSQKTYDSQRPSGSSVLWAHLLRKDVLPSPANADLPLPPLAPVDKSATSTRILLLDTQAQLQKFGQAVDGLTSRVDSAKHEINLVKTLFKQDREVLMNDIVDRVNRSQSEIQKSIGKPAQASKLEDIEKNLDLRLDNMNQRLDAMQMLYQTYMQTLQNQNQVLQSLQEQQSTIIGALTPLLPLLQTIPPQIESARNDLSESLATRLSQFHRLDRSSNHSLPPVSTTYPSKKRSSCTSTTECKRRRVDENLIEGPSSTITHTSFSTRTKDGFGSTSTRKIMVSIGPNQLKGQTIHRRPLADLPLTKFAAKPSFNTDPFRPVDIPKHRPCPETPVIVPQTPMTDIDDSIARFRPGYIQQPPRQLVERSPTASIADGSSLYQPSSPYSSTAFASRAPGIPIPRTIETKSRFKPVGHKAIARAVPTTARGSFHLQNATNPNLTPARLPTTPAMASAATVPVSRSFATATNIDDVDPTPTDFSLVTNLAPSTLRQRRSPFREGRRFIPLDDSDTSDDEQRKT